MLWCLCSFNPHPITPKHHTSAATDEVNREGIQGRAIRGRASPCIDPLPPSGYSPCSQGESSRVGVSRSSSPENGGGVPQGRRGRFSAPCTVFSMNQYQKTYPCKLCSVMVLLIVWSLLATSAEAQERSRRGSGSGAGAGANVHRPAAPQRRLLWTQPLSREMLALFFHL